MKITHSTYYMNFNLSWNLLSDSNNEFMYARKRDGNLYNS